MKTDFKESLSKKNSAGTKKYFSADMTDSKKDSNTETTDSKKDIAAKITDDEKIDFVAARILELYRPAFEELAK